MQRKIFKGLELLEKYDEHLLQIDINERTLTHLMALYYHSLFDKWDVDCEYNKSGSGPKEVLFDPYDLLQRMSLILREHDYRVGNEIMRNFADYEMNTNELANLAEQLENPHIEYDPEQELWFFILRQLDGSTIRKSIIPDIIVHRRGRRNNHIAIEVKKTRGPGTPNIASKVYDILKLQALVKDPTYNYKHGYYIELPVSNLFSLHGGYIARPDILEPRVTIVEPS